MATDTSRISALHFEHQLWTNELRFFEDEINIYEGYLSDLVTHSNDKEMLAKLEHFQNQFIRQKEVLDELHSDIHKHEQHLSRLLQDQRVSDAGDDEKHKTMAERIDRFKAIYADLKQNFLKFFASYR
jgi:hypothetical protein